MKKLLIVAATEFEIQPLLKALNAVLPIKSGIINSFSYKKLQIDVLVTGVGMVNTAFAMGSLKNQNYNLVINAGVCGAFNEEIKIGELVNVVEDCFPELGAENGDSFLTLSEMGLGNENVKNENCFTNSQIEIFKKVKGLTVNTVHGSEKSIEKIKARLNADIETMEGAAFLMACNTYKWKAVQIRTVSNKVEVRNKDNWKMPLAIANLNDFLIHLLNHL